MNLKPAARQVTLSVVAIVGLAGALALVWYQGHSQSKPWDKSAITATFEDIATDNDDNLRFWYRLRNNTPYDYGLPSASQSTVMARRSDGSLSPPKNYIWHDAPVFVPSGRTVLFGIYLAEKSYPARPANPEDIHKWKDSLKSWIRNSNLDGFVVFDPSRRYEIVLPKGW